MIVADILTKAKKLNNYEKDATGVTTLWPSTTEYRATCPAGKRWILLGGFVYRAVSATLSVSLWDISNNKIALLSSEAAASAGTTFPTAAFKAGLYWVLDPGEYINALFGVAQDVNSYASCVVLEVGI